MKSMLFKLVEWFAKGGVPAFMIAAGLTVAVFTGLDILVKAALDQAVSHFEGLPSDVLALAQLAGAGQFFSIIGGAILTRVALVTATSALSLKRA